MGKVIVLVSCVSKKADTPQKAKDLYISDLFKKSLAYACSLEPDGIFILSALHHHFGMSKDLLDRLKWHICQKHTTSEIKSGYISTFRQTLSGVLGLDASLSENAVNDLLDSHCLVEYDYTDTEKEAKLREEAELCAPDYYYPLNIQSNKSVPKIVRQQIQAARQQHKK